MGKGRDKRKDKRKQRHGDTIKKTERKTEVNEQRRQRASDRRIFEAAAYDDVEALVGQYKQKHHVDPTATIEECDTPGPRINGSMIAHPTQKHELVIFGGEYWNGRHTVMYNDLYFFRADRDQWRHVSSAFEPAPRSSHQAVVFKHYMYLFGGEFTAPSQNAAYHFKDMWRFNFSNNTWSDISIRGGPSARSGHRMVLWKKNLVIFGGFHAANVDSDAIYFNDLWFLRDIDGEMSWDAVSYSVNDDVPSARSACCMCCYQDNLFVFGGYSSGDGKGIAHNDLWRFDLHKMKWERLRSNKGIPPSVRSGMSIICDNKRALMFGGVWDYDEDGNDIASVFYNDMFSLNLESGRWFPVLLKGQKSLLLLLHLLLLFLLLPLLLLLLLILLISPCLISILLLFLLLLILLLLLLLLLIHHHLLLLLLLLLLPILLLLLPLIPPHLILLLLLLFSVSSSSSSSSSYSSCVQSYNNSFCCYMWKH